MVEVGRHPDLAVEVLPARAGDDDALAEERALDADEFVEFLQELDGKIRTECPLLGKRVIITGTSRDDLNGKVGVATDFDHAKGRYVVAWGGNGEKSQVMKIKPTNLRLA